MMKIDRRSFLALGIGAAAGTALSPLPWKLTDDSSIWTQNWPWTPVPEDGNVSWETTVCSLCPGGCGIRVRKIEDRIVKIEGRDSFPINNGRICALGISGVQLLYGPGRITSPMKRTGKRGSGEWKKITWDEAITEVSNKLKKLETENKQDSLACISGSDKGIVPQLLNRLLMAFGSPNFIKTPSMQDSFRTVLKKMHGKSDAIEAGYDFKNATFILSFGSGLLEGWGSPVHMCQTNSNWKSGKTKIIQIEQRLSKTAAAADRVFTINPGTEADLALGLATVIINEGLYSKKFTGAFATGFPDFKNMLNKHYSPDSVAKTTGMKRHLIIELARHFALSGSRSIAVCGKGKGEDAGSLKEFMAIHSLNAVIGNINEKGGVHAIETNDYVSWAKDVAVLEAIDGKDRIDDAGTSAYPDVKYLLHKLPEKILSAKESPVNVLFVSKANPMYTLSDTKKTAEAFARIPFIVSFSPYMDETAAFSDLILPDHNYLEKTEDIPVLAGLDKPFLALSTPVINPMYDTMHTGDAVIKIGKSLGATVSRFFKWDSYEDCLKKTMGTSFKKLRAEGYIKNERYQPKPWISAFGGTFSKFAFSGKKLPAPELSGSEKEFPLVLLPKDSMAVSSGFIGAPAFTVKTIPDTELSGNNTVVEINPDTGNKLGINDGATAQLITPFGKETVLVTFFHGIMPGVIATAKGLGHTAYNNYLKEKGLNFNTVAGVVEDPATGLNVCRSVRATLKNV